MPTSRFRAAGRFSLKHLTASALIAALCAVLVFLVWYPFPYGELSGGQGLFALVVTVDVIVGPVLSFVIYDPAKRRRELWRDLSVIFILQAAALGYGFYSVAEARPVGLAFEGDRFRIVAVPDVERDTLDRAPGELATLSWTGPRLLGVRLLEPTDPAYPKSIQMALQGIHPAFRPERWVAYDTQRAAVGAAAKPLADLRRRRPASAAEIDRAVRDSGVAEDRLGYLPLHSGARSDWSVLVDRSSGEPVAFVPVDGW